MMGRWGEVTPLWFGGGRVDAFAPEEDIYWGHEPEWLKDDRHDKSKRLNGDKTGLEEPLGAVQMGLIYVNPVSILLVSTFHNSPTHPSDADFHLFRKDLGVTLISLHQLKIFVRHSGGWE
jgi:hypothetical protein